MEKLKIGNVEIDNPFVLAPMAAVNCTSYRLFCKKHGVGLIYTQMIDADKLVLRKDDEVKDFLNIHKDERPVSVQLIGANTENLVKAVKMVEPYADIIDYNMGCILEDYLALGCGGKLLTNFDRVKENVSAMVKATKKPITCKIRIGWDGQTINGVALCQMLEECGVAAIAIHGRTVQQGYGKRVNWTIMKQIKERAKIPIMANGDVTTYQEGLDLLEKTGCDFVMIGREAQHAPWVFNKDFVRTNDSVKAEILDFIDYYQKYERRNSIQELTQHVYWMFRDIKTSLRAKWVSECTTVEEVKEFLDRID
ncbi:tRNA-dihydrouridine synthase family protein [archaeon]|nr:tRNA-dihydrouridine synthase family protein [archaeon]